MVPSFTVEAPAAMPLATTPRFRITVSCDLNVILPGHSDRVSITAVKWGTPTPATRRVISTSKTSP
jgi:hypothetical protein